MDFTEQPFAGGLPAVISVRACARTGARLVPPLKTAAVKFLSARASVGGRWHRA